MPRLGQHFLENDHYLERITQAADIAPGEHILEIGPGRGDLTQRLLDAGAHVTAIEIDERLARKLPERVDDPDQRLTTVHADALEHPWPRFDKLVANIPYQASSPILFQLLETSFERAILTVQKEFAERMTAPLGTKHAGRLTVKTALEAKAELLFTIPAGAFTPPPNVESAAIRLTPRPRPPAEDERLLHEIIDTAFQQRRKMLRNSLQPIPGAHEALKALGLATKRPAKIPPATWIKLADRIHKDKD